MLTTGLDCAGSAAQKRAATSRQRNNLGKQRNFASTQIPTLSLCVGGRFVSECGHARRGPAAHTTLVFPVLHNSHSSHLEMHHPCALFAVSAGARLEWYGARRVRLRKKQGLKPRVERKGPAARVNSCPDTGLPSQGLFQQLFSRALSRHCPIQRFSDSASQASSRAGRPLLALLSRQPADPDPLTARLL
jgi:hypothetical protein